MEPPSTVSCSTCKVEIVGGGGGGGAGAESCGTNFSTWKISGINVQPSCCRCLKEAEVITWGVYDKGACVRCKHLVAQATNRDFSPVVVQQTFAEQARDARSQLHSRVAKVTPIAAAAAGIAAIEQAKSGE